LPYALVRQNLEILKLKVSHANCAGGLPLKNPVRGGKRAIKKAIKKAGRMGELHPVSSSLTGQLITRSPKEKKGSKKVQSFHVTHYGLK
jgi:hypothetical protein